ncbi:MAG: DUF2306 domain-containing protein [Roseobacter sp.]
MRHRWIGYLWVTLMGLVALSSFWIQDIRQLGPFSFIHILSVVVLVNLYFAIRAARRGDVASHRSSMRWLFFAALVGAGVFTLLPGRAMHLVLFGS